MNRVIKFAPKRIRPENVRNFLLLFYKRMSIPHNKILEFILVFHFPNIVSNW